MIIDQVYGYASTLRRCACSYLPVHLVPREFFEGYTGGKSRYNTAICIPRHLDTEEWHVYIYPMSRQYLPALPTYIFSTPIGSLVPISLANAK